MSSGMRVLGRLGRTGALPPVAAAVVEALTGFTQVLTRRPALASALSHPDVRVPYLLRSRALGVERFPLALDGTAHAGARRIVADVLAASGAAHRAAVDAAAAEGVARMAAAGDQVDLVADVIDPVLRSWVERWFGLEGHGAVLQTVGRVTMHAMFLNPERPRQATDAAALDRACTLVAEARGALLAPMGQAPDGTVAHALLGHPEVDDVDAVALLVGLTVGPLALTSRALATIVDHLLDDHTLDEVDDEGAAVLLVAGLAARPPLPGLPRTCPVAVEIPLARATITLPPGPFLAGTEAAGGFDPDPEDLAFGLGPHTCMGRDQFTVIGSALLQAIGGRRPRRRPGDEGRRSDGEPPDPAFGHWPFPGSLVVDLCG